VPFVSASGTRALTRAPKILELIAHVVVRLGVLPARNGHESGERVMIGSSASIARVSLPARLPQRAEPGGRRKLLRMRGNEQKLSGRVFTMAQQ